MSTAIAIGIAVPIALIALPPLLQLFAYWCYENLPFWLYLLVGLVTIFVIVFAALLGLAWLLEHAS